jgi:hypothetical protein
MSMLLLVCSVGCTPPEGAARGHYVVYELAWDTEGVEFGARGKGWAVTNDLGYRVELLEGYLSSYSIAFLPCDNDPAAKGPPASGRLWELLGAATAYAAPSAVAFNPAMLLPGHIENLAKPRLRTTETRRPPPTRFCRVHYLVARAERDAVSLPFTHQMVDVSLFVRGYRQSVHDAEPVAFSIETKAANGVAQQVALTAGGEGVEIDTARSNATATVTRKLATLFDGVDFAAMTDKQVSRELLNRVIEGTEITVRMGEGSRN